MTLWERMQAEAALAELEQHDPWDTAGDVIYDLRAKLTDNR